jgi:Domain of unknown function (DUF4365)
MTKTITQSQLLGELGETAVKKIVLEMGFIYETRGRLEAGTDGLIELRDCSTGTPLGKLLGVQVKSTSDGKYIRETDRQFEYLLKSEDLRYWRQSNIPVIIVLWRRSDGSAYWKDVTDAVGGDERRLRLIRRLTDSPVPVPIASARSPSIAARRACSSRRSMPAKLR